MYLKELGSFFIWAELVSQVVEFLAISRPSTRMMRYTEAGVARFNTHFINYPHKLCGMLVNAVK